MASTFAQNIQTVTQPHGTAISNKTLQSLGLLNRQRMTDTAALAGTTGVDCALIHGDMWDQFEALDTKDVLKDQLLTVYGNSTDRSKRIWSKL